MIKRPRQGNNGNRNAFTDQNVGRTAVSNKFSRAQKISGKIRVKTLVNTTNPQPVYLDFPGLTAVGATLITDQMKHYERWAIDDLKVQYTPIVSKTVSGSIAMAPDYDPCDFPVSDVTQMSVSDFYRSSSVSDSFTQDIHMPYRRPNPEDMLYVAPTSDPRLTSAGFINFIATCDNAVDTEIGYIELLYSIRVYLKTPVPTELSTGGSDRTVTVEGNGSGYTMKMDKSYALADSLYMYLNSAMDVEEVVAATYHTVSNGRFIDRKQDTVPEGSRVFFKPAQFRIATAGDVANLTQSAYVGTLASDPCFNNILTWVGLSASNGGFSLSDLVSFT